MPDPEYELISPASKCRTKLSVTNPVYLLFVALKFRWTSDAENPLPL